MKYRLQQPNAWSRWAIVDERGTEICDGPYEQKKAGLLIVDLLNNQNSVSWDRRTYATNPNLSPTDTV